MEKLYCNLMTRQESIACSPYIESKVWKLFYQNNPILDECDEFSKNYQCYVYIHIMYADINVKCTSMYILM